MNNEENKKSTEGEGEEEKNKLHYNKAPKWVIIGLTILLILHVCLQFKMCSGYSQMRENSKKVLDEIFDEQ